MTGQNANFLRKSTNLMLTKTEIEKVQNYIRRTDNVCMSVRQLLLNEIATPSIVEIIKPVEYIPKNIRFKLTPEENEAFEAYLSKNKVDISSLIKHLILREAESL